MPDETQDKVSTPDELADIKAQLAEEQKAVVARDEAISEKDANLAELETALSEAKKGNEALAASLAAVKEASNSAVAKYLTMVKALNPTIPENMLVGGTIEEIDLSIERGKAMVASVKKAMEAEASAAKVPAGAPTRGAISLEGMSPKEKIAYGIQQKGGVVA
jgi:multidrug efflux pump subunit AcrA (membrane-fusion protein)